MKIAVTGLNATDNPGPGVPVIRSLLDSFEDIKIIGLTYDILEPGIYMNGIADNYYMIPFPSSGHNILFERIKYIHSKENLDFIIPTLDSELMGFIQISQELNEMGIKTYLPTLEQLNLRAKDKLFKTCSDNNITVPKNILAHNISDIKKISDDFEYPVVIKGIFYDAYVVHNFDEAMNAFNKLASKWGLPIIIQEFVTGNEFNVVALGDGTGDTIGAVAMRKTFITDKGKGWAGITIDDPELIELAHKTISVLKWKSGMELEYIKSSSDDKYYLLEINPRFPAWVYLATGSGQNLPSALVRLGFEEKIEKFSKYDIGKMFVRHSWDLITDMSKYEKLIIYGEA